MITKNIALNITACLSGLEFSFDELILETAELFEREGIPGFLKVLIAFTNDMVVEKWKSGGGTDCCSSPCLIRNGKRNKNIYTSLGNIDFEWTILRCKNCNKIHHPLKEFFDLGKYQKLTNEFEKLCMETVYSESFRRSVQTIKKHRRTDFNHRSLHRWFMTTDSDEVMVRHDDLITLLADGTGYKKFVSQIKLERKNKLMEKTGQKLIEKSKRGEVKILMGINKKNKVVPLGAWTSESWKTIGNLIYKANNQNKKIVPKKVANILVADGEIGLNRGLYKLTHHQQRCLWHIPHDLRPLMKYQDKAPEEDVKYALGQVHSIFQIEIPEKDFDKVETQELVEMNEKIRNCEMQMKLLSEYLDHRGHNQASTYVSNAKKNLFTYLRYWMKTGVVTPKVTSQLERLMREIGRRIKKFAFNWSEKGCAKMTRIIIKILCDPKSWEHHWDKKMKLGGNIRLCFNGIN